MNYKNNEINNRITLGNISFKLKSELVLDNLARFSINSSYNFKKLILKKPFSIEYESLKNFNFIIVGSSGSGKSTLMKDMMHQLSDNSILLIDPHGEHYDLIKSLNGDYLSLGTCNINIFSIDNLNYRFKVNELLNLFTRVFNLGSHQSYRLFQILSYMYRKKVYGYKKEDPNFNDLINEINIFIKNSKSKTDIESLENMKDRFILLGLSNGNYINIDELFNGIHSLDMSRLNNPKLRFIYLTEVFSKLYRHMHESKILGKDRFYIFIDEGNEVLDEFSNSMQLSKFYREGRKFGLGFIISVQDITLLPKDIISNSDNVFIFNSKESSGLNYLSNLITANDPKKANLVKSVIYNLPVNNFLANDRFGGVIWVVGKSYNRIITKTNITNPDKIIDYLNNPISLSELDKKVGLDKSTIDYIMDNNHIDKLYSDGQLFVMKKKNVGLDHELSIIKISKALSRLLIKYYIGHGANTPDLVFYYDGMKIGLEYETGKKNIDDTSKMVASRFDNFDFVIIVTKSDKCKIYKDYFKKYKQVQVIDLDSFLSGNLLGFLKNLRLSAPQIKHL